MASKTNYIAPSPLSIGSIVASLTDLSIDKTSPWDTEVTSEGTYELTMKRYWSDDTQLGVWKDSIAGSLATELTTWTQQGAQEMVQILEASNPLDLELFTVKRRMGINGSKLLETGAINNIVLYEIATQKHFQAFHGHKKNRHKYSDPNSIYYAEKESPVWFLDEGKIWVYPFDSTLYMVEVFTFDYPRHGVTWSGTASWIASDYDEDSSKWPVNDDTGGPGYGAPQFAIDTTAVYSPLSAIHNWVAMKDEMTNDPSGGIYNLPTPQFDERIPEKYNQGIAIYVAKELIKYRMRKLHEALPQMADYSGTQSDPPSSADGWERVRWYIEQDEDTELAQIKMAELNGEQQQVLTKYQWYQQQAEILNNKYKQFYGGETQKKGAK